MVWVTYSLPVAIETKRPTTAPTAGKAPTRVATSVSKSSKSTLPTKTAIHGRTANKEAAGSLKGMYLHVLVLPHLYHFTITEGETVLETGHVS